MQIELGGHFKRAALKFHSRIAVQSAERSLTIDLVNRTLAARLARYKIPRQLRIADNLPG
jgi:hypothetical protein